jgi:hypothetical protein
MKNRRCKRLYVLTTVVVTCVALLAAVTTNAADKKPNTLVISGDEGPPGAQASEDAMGEIFASDAHVSLPVPLQSGENFSFGAVTESSNGEESASELNRKLTNPVSSIWSISNQFNNFELNNGHWNNNWNFQPVLPVSLTKDRRSVGPRLTDQSLMD